jgi:putative GTP pyrophosphokinase
VLNPKDGDYISRELRECAKFVADLDEKMEVLNNEIQKYGEKSGE